MTSTSKSAYRLNYLNARGSGEIIRWIFAYAGVAYEDNRLDPVTQRPLIKQKAPYGKVPFLEVDGKVLGESNAITRFLARRFGLAGTNEWESAEIDALADYIAEARKKFPLWTSANVFDKFQERVEGIKEEYLRESFTVLKRLERMLKDNVYEGAYFFGTSPSWADFVVTRFLDSLTVFETDVLLNYPLLKALQLRVRNLKGIKEWIATRPETPF